MKQILIAVALITIATMLAGAGTFAYFSDVATSTGNTFTAGSIDLKIRDHDESYGDSVTATWTATDMKPGDEFPFDVPLIMLRNDGTIPGDHLEITCDYSVVEEIPQTESDTDPNTNLDPDKMAKQMIITRCEYYNDAWTIDLLTDPDPDWSIQDTDGDTKITFFDLKNDPLDNLPPPDGVTHFELGVKFSEGAGNDFQGDTLDLTVTFTLNQDSSQ